MKSKFSFSKRLSAMAFCGVLLVGTSQSAQAKPKPTKKTKTTTTTRPSNKVTSSVQQSTARLSFNGFVTQSAIALEGTLVSLSAPIWNNASNTPWARKPDTNDPLPVRFRNGVVKVENVLYGDEAKPGETMAVTFGGSGLVDSKSPGRDLYQTGDYADGMLSGAIKAGDRVILVLRHANLPFQGGTTKKVWYPVDDSYGIWTLQGSAAVNFDPVRTTTADKLRAALLAERNDGPRLDRIADSPNAPFEAAPTATTTIVRPAPSLQDTRGPLGLVTREQVDSLTISVLSDNEGKTISVMDGSKSIGGFGTSNRDPVPARSCMWRRAGNVVVIVSVSPVALTTDAAVRSRQVIAAPGVVVLVTVLSESPDVISMAVGNEKTEKYRCNVA